MIYNHPFLRVIGSTRGVVVAVPSMFQPIKHGKKKFFNETVRNIVRDDGAFLLPLPPALTNTRPTLFQIKF